MCAASKETERRRENVHGVGVLLTSCRLRVRGHGSQQATQDQADAPTHFQGANEEAPHLAGLTRGRLMGTAQWCRLGRGRWVGNVGRGVAMLCFKTHLSLIGSHIMEPSVGP